MSRMKIVSNYNADASQSELFDQIRAGLGTVPNFMRVFANSPVALEAFLGLHKIAGEGELDPQTRERIALTVAERNGCEYCISAHVMIARNAGLDREEIEAARMGSSSDEKAALVVNFARLLMENNGDVTNGELMELKNAGFSDAEIVEIITHVGMNILTNFIGKVSQVEIDFPRVNLLSVA